MVREPPTRSSIDAVRKSVADNGESTDSDNAIERWLEWAERKADEADPIVNRK